MFSVKDSNQETRGYSGEEAQLLGEGPPKSVGKIAFAIKM
jgi:hypothetical protein